MELCVGKEANNERAADSTHLAALSRIMIGAAARLCTFRIRAVKFCASTDLLQHQTIVQMTVSRMTF
jgi:tartrate dehydratase beta subunit/fumarate hydratase class I family protein